MQKLLREYLDELNKRQKKGRKVAVAVILMAVIVVGSVIGVLTQYGVAMTGTPKCGMEEHAHSKGCYTKEAACGLEEGEGHTHIESCRPPAGLACGQEEAAGHTHTEACRPQAELSCGQQEAQVQEDAQGQEAARGIRIQKAATLCQKGLPAARKRRKAIRIQKPAIPYRKDMYAA